MTQASVNIQQQFKDGGVVPADLAGQSAVSKKYVDDQLEIRDQNIAATAGAASAAQADINNHEMSPMAHPAQNITYFGTVQAQNVRQAIDKVNGRISEIVAQAGNDNTEIVDARSGFPVLGARLDTVDKQLEDIAVNIRNYNAIGDGTTDNTSAVEDAISAVAVQGGVVLIPQGVYLTNSITVPMNVSLWIVNGGRLKVNDGETVTINGFIQAGLYHIFDGEVIGNPRNECIYPEWFGLSGSNVNNAPAINQAIGLLPITGGTVKFGLGGWFKVSESIVVSKSAVRLQGQGTGNATNIYTDDHTFDIITSNFPGTQIEDLSISALGASSEAYAINSTESLRVNNVTMDGVHSGIFSSGVYASLKNITMRHLKTAAGIGIDFAGTNEVKEVDGVIMENAPGSQAYAGIRIGGGSGYTLTNCQLMKMGMALDVVAYSSHVPSISATNCWFDTSDYGVRIDAPSSYAVQRLRFSNCWFGGNTFYGFQVLRGSVKGITIDSSEFLGNGNDGFRIEEGASVDGVKINGCSIAGNGGSGISLGAGTSNFMIIANRIGPCGDYTGNLYGIYIPTGSSDYYIISNNDLHGNTSGQIVDGGQGTHKSVINNITT